MVDRFPVCQAPFRQLLIKPDGRVTPCCYLCGHHVGHLGHHSLHEIWHSNKMEKLRREHFLGQHRTCAARMAQLNCHLEHQSHSSAIVNAPVSRLPKKLDLRLNSYCNLTCTMCDVWQGPNGQVTKMAHWKEVFDNHLAWIEEIDMLGGEPFIQKDTFKLMDFVSKNNPDCRWGFVTNGQFGFSSVQRRFLDRLQLRYFQISADATDASVYQNIRRGGNFTLLRRTQEQAMAWHQRRQTDNRPFELRFSFCTVQQNWHQLPEFLDDCHIKGVTPIVQVANYDPSGQASLAHLTHEQRHSIYRQLGSSIHPSFWSTWAPVRELLRSQRGQNTSPRLEKPL